MRHNVLMVRVLVYAFAYTLSGYGVDYSVAVFEVKAIPEPQVAEQQDCGPAFIFERGSATNNRHC